MPIEMRTFSASAFACPSGHSAMIPESSSTVTGMRVVLFPQGISSSCSPSGLYRSPWKYDKVPIPKRQRPLDSLSRKGNIINTPSLLMQVKYLHFLLFLPHPIQSNTANGAREVHMKTRDGWMAEATLRPSGWESTVHEKTAMLPGPLCRVIASSSLGLLGLLQNELWKLKFLEHFRHEQNCNCQKLLQMVLFSPFPRRIPHTRSRAMNHRIFPH